MARGHYRTSKKICLYCGKRASENVKIYRHGLKNQPDFLCERCFDINATDQEKQNKEKLLVVVRGGERY